MGFRRVVRLIPFVIAQIVEAAAGRPHRVEAHLADDGRIEVAHRVVQDGRDGGSVHQIRHRLLAAGVLAFLGVRVAIERRVHQGLRDGVLHHDVAIAVEGLLLFRG